MKCHWLGGLIFPIALLNAYEMTLKNKKIKYRRIDSELTDQDQFENVQSPLDDALYLQGLYMTKAKITHGTLDDNNIVPGLYNVPIICTFYLPEGGEEEEQEGNFYDCPVLTSQYRYLNNGENDVIMRLKIFSEVGESYWAIKGVGIICNKH